MFVSRDGSGGFGDETCRWQLSAWGVDAAFRRGLRPIDDARETSSFKRDARLVTGLACASARATSPKYGEEVARLERTHRQLGGPGGRKLPANLAGQTR